jgi:hypothetical protein
MSDFEWLDLEKITGKKVSRIDGHVSSEFGRDVLVFELFRIHFEDGSSIFVEGEHDTPYIANGKAPFDNETLAKFLEDA